MANPICINQPSEFNTSNHGPGLEVCKEKLTIRYVGESRHTNDVGGIQANLPVPQHVLVYYFEITVLDRGEQGKIAIGFSDKNFRVNRQPGWEPGSYGYHGDDGHKFHAAGIGEEYGPKFGTGDTVGAGIHLGRQELFFTKNGTKLRVAFRGVNVEQLYPTIGLHSKNEHVRVNFGQQPFKFDLEALMSEEREQQQAAVQRMCVTAGDVHQVVRNYLLFQGFGGTLAAFDTAAGGEGVEQAMCEDSGDPLASTLGIRQNVRMAIMQGRISDAIDQLQQQCPMVLQGSLCSVEVQFHLQCQQYIELIREARITEAMQFAQSVLVGLKPGAAHSDSQLRDVVALIAYEQPERSALAHLLQPSQREVVADAVNAAILQATRASSKPEDNTNSPLEAAEAASGKPQSALQTLLQQLVASSSAMHDDGGGSIGESRDEVFNPDDYLSPS